jgi:hypothetical protein
MLHDCLTELKIPDKILQPRKAPVSNLDLAMILSSLKSLAPGSSLYFIYFSCEENAHLRV